MKNAALLLISTSTKSEGFIHWLEHHLLACPFKKLTGLDCPGCGLQRSIIALLKGDVVASFKFYPPTLAIISLTIFMLLHLKFDFKNGALIIKAMYIFITAVIIINYIYKVYHQQLF
ncbi:DUF2752 domain-containing protein [Pedobacter xixiisoli]|uniref:DUF2752 domain-containing protein n=1 Tax=Pedobacter xixiisoli TaxID=1476464 RepID=A0A285ZZH5_9SPHI|nr:DUF2752 domain-containing protein [Pedobacter xixiisoli]SOD15059.1 Protein of unknown function [Pedobacter xixiisoli]